MMLWVYRRNSVSSELLPVYGMMTVTGFDGKSAAFWPSAALETAAAPTHNNMARNMNSSFGDSCGVPTDGAISCEGRKSRSRHVTTMKRA